MICYSLIGSAGFCSHFDALIVGFYFSRISLLKNFSNNLRKKKKNLFIFYNNYQIINSMKLKIIDQIKRKDKEYK